MIENAALPSPPPQRCPLCGAAMSIAEHGVRATIFRCVPCRVTVQCPIEPARASVTPAD
jgi:hypothetical protein